MSSLISSTQGEISKRDYNAFFRSSFHSWSNDGGGVGEGLLSSVGPAADCRVGLIQRMGTRRRGFEKGDLG